MNSATPQDDPLDVLIVGAGPAGTAAAFRAAELGLSVMAMDQDEILGVVHDWVSPDGDENKDKRVDSSYGPGGKRVPFPVGGDLIAALVFGDQVPASDLYQRWMEVYRSQGIATRSGWELVGLERGADEVFTARCRQASGEETEVRTRDIVLALGRGSPHKLDCPGDKEKVSYKLSIDTSGYIGAPVCVIGGGTSAAEAVIAISTAKVAAEDATDVYWAYRKRRLPKVNTTLAESFFRCFSGNGNITYLPFSFPLAILAGDDGSPVLALRSERTESIHKPPTGTYFEFPAERVLACIGAEVPANFLRRITLECDPDSSLRGENPDDDMRGIRRLTSADDDEEYLAVSPLLESKISNIFLVGDLLSPCYIQTTDFHPATEQSTVIDHTGNFKQGMTDGVLAIEAIKMRRDGIDDAAIRDAIEAKKETWRQAHTQRQEESKRTPKPRQPEPEPAPSPAATKTVLIGAEFAQIDSESLQEVTRHFFLPGQIVIGRSAGDLTFPSDDALRDRHAGILVETEACYVTTDGYDGGSCWVRLGSERTIEVGDQLIVGDARLRIDKQGGKFVLSQLDAHGTPTKQHEISSEGTTLGRTTLDPQDLKMSRRHVSLQSAGDVVKVRDFGSTNGTYLIVDGALRLNEGDEILLGQHFMRFLGMEKGAATAPSATRSTPPAPSAPAAAAAPATAAATNEPAAATPATAAPADAVPTAGPPSVIIGDRTIEMSADQTILDKLIAEGMATEKPAQIAGDVQLLWECKKGTCGKCVITVKSGMETLSPLSGKEKRTMKLILPELEEIGLDVDPGSCHLACRATVSGPTHIELLGNTETE